MESSNFSNFVELDFEGNGLFYIHEITESKKPFYVCVSGWRKVLLKWTLPIFVKNSRDQIKESFWFAFLKLLNPVFWGAMNSAFVRKYESPVQ
jgi:hypothetical protein